MKKEFDYGIVVYKHRFNLTRSLDDYVETILNKVIRIGLVYKYKLYGWKELFAEMQILYRDENNVCQCLCLDLHDYTFVIKHKGDMMIEL